MNTQHTPGPWILNGFRVESPTSRFKRAQICEVYGLGNRDDAGQAANAALIAAAPAILAALERAEGLLLELRASDLDGPEDIETLAMIEAAIAQARSTPTAEPAPPIPAGADDLRKASEGFLCRACGRPEADCSADPCDAVIADLEG